MMPLNAWPIPSPWLTTEAAPGLLDVTESTNDCMPFSGEVLAGTEVGAGAALEVAGPGVVEDDDDVGAAELVEAGKCVNLCKLELCGHVVRTLSGSRWRWRFWRTMGFGMQPVTSSRTRTNYRYRRRGYRPNSGRRR